MCSTKLYNFKTISNIITILTVSTCFNITKYIAICWSSMFFYSQKELPLSLPDVLSAKSPGHVNLQTKQLLNFLLIESFKEKQLSTFTVLDAMRVLIPIKSRILLMFQISTNLSEIFFMYGIAMYCTFFVLILIQYISLVMNKI